MLVREDSHELERRDGGHDRWLAMQSAYAEYRRVSEALESMHLPADDSSASQASRLIPLEGQQQAAFERYLEARIEFLEFRFDESNQPPPVVSSTLPIYDPEETKPGSRWASITGKPIVQILAAVLLCTTAFSLVREQKHVRELEASRDQLQSTLNQTRDSLQALTQKLDTWQPPQLAAVQQVQHTSPAPARHSKNSPARIAVRKTPAPGHWRRLPTANVPPKSMTASQNLGSRSYADRHRTRKPT